MDGWERREITVDNGDKEERYRNEIKSRVFPGL